jgi:hypothetical protein
MTLSDHKGRQLIRDTIHKCFLEIFLTVFIDLNLYWTLSMYKQYSTSWAGEEKHK